MLQFLCGKASDRKLRLFGCACCRAVWAIADSDIRKAIETAEQYADGLVSWDERQAAANAIEPKVAYFVDLAGFVAAAASAILWPDAQEGAKHATIVVIDIHETNGYADAYEDCSNELRCIFGPSLFRQVPFDATWRTPHVEALAQCIY